MTIQLDHIAADTVLDPASEAIAAIARGEIVVIVDDEDRENEGDLVAAADHADAGVINFMITHGRGLVCLALPAARAAELELPPWFRTTRTTWAQPSPCRSTERRHAA